MLPFARETEQAGLPCTARSHGSSELLGGAVPLITRFFSVMFPTYGGHPWSSQRNGYGYSMSCNPWPAAMDPVAQEWAFVGKAICDLSGGATESLGVTSTATGPTEPTMTDVIPKGILKGIPNQGIPNDKPLNFGDVV